MAVNTTITSLSQTASLNGPDGATDGPNTADDALRYHGAFIAQLRDGAGFAAGAIPAALGFTPLQQGGGAGQSASKVYIGWNTGGLRVQVDSTDFGTTWPISVSGNAATATSATTASNASALGGAAPAEYVKRLTANTLALAWDGVAGAVVPYVDGTPQFSPTYWAIVQGRPTQLSQFTNNLGTINSASISGSTIQGVLSASGQTVNWTGFLVSDERVKRNVQATAEDSRAKIDRLDFKQFDFDLEKVPFQTADHQALGVIAQQAAAIDPTWAGPVAGSDYLHLRDQPLLMAALHAVQQLSAEVRELRAALTKG